MCLFWSFVVWFLQFCVHSYKIDKDIFILYDSGTGKGSESVFTNLGEILSDSNKQKLRNGKVRRVTVDAVVLFHPDNNHYGGFKYLLEKKRIGANDLYLFVPQFRHHLGELLRTSPLNMGTQ